MFRDVLKKKQQLSDEEVKEILQRNKYGTLALYGDNDYPYSVPLNYTYNEGKFYIHGFNKGHRAEAIAKNPRVSFSIIDKDTLVPEEFTTYFRSVILFGRAKLLSGDDAMRFVMRTFVNKYSADFKERGEAVIERNLKALAVYEIEIDHITGKQSMELVKKDVE